MKYVSVLFVLLFFGVPAWAEDVTVDINLCREMVSHTPRGDVAFQPGVDAKGKPVAPADLQTSQDFNFLKNIREIPLTVDLAERLEVDAKGLEMKTDLPPLQLRPDGRVFWNGQDLTQQAVYMCDQQGQTPPMVIRPDAGVK